MLYINSFWKFVLDIFFPKKCINCRKYGEELCFECAKEIEMVVTSVCPLCGKISKSGKICAVCKNKSKFVLKGIISAAVYDSGPTKEIIHHLKYSGMTRLSDILAELIVIRLRKEKFSTDTVVVPVPLHESRFTERGFNQSELIGKYVANKIGLPGGNAIERSKNRKPQAELKRSQRLSNLSGCFEVVDPGFIAGKTVLLIDDVATTGATLNECAKVLRSSGAKEVWGVVVAHG